MTLDAAAARGGRPGGGGARPGVEETALAITRIVDNNMMGALRWC
jgi:hypothetical protein